MTQTTGVALGRQELARFEYDAVACPEVAELVDHSREGLRILEKSEIAFEILRKRNT